MIKAVSDLTKLNWDQVWQMNAYEFFNYLSFYVENNKYEENQINLWKARH
jgi:hypothetical protein